MERLRGQSFVYVGVNADSDRATARRSARDAGMDWVNVWDDGHPIGPIATSWAVTDLPTTFLLDRAGRIRHRFLRGEALERAIEGLLAETSDDAGLIAAPR